MSSQAQINANRANAQHSTGPQSSTGKATSSRNAVKTGLTGVTVLLRSEEDAEAYRAHILSYEKQFNPVGPEESALVQSIADIRWRLNRIPALEMALLTIGRQELGGSNEAYDQPEFAAIVEMEIRRAYVKDFRNLHLQENRLVNRRQREMAGWEFPFWVEAFVFLQKSGQNRLPFVVLAVDHRLPTPGVDVTVLQFPQGPRLCRILLEHVGHEQVQIMPEERASR